MTLTSTRILAAAMVAAWTTLPALAQDTTATDTTPAETTAGETDAGAEDTATDEAATEDTATDGSATDAGAADGAATAATAADLPDTLDIETFGDWELRCDTASGGCFMYQLASDPQGNPVSELTLVQLPEEGEAVAGVTAITPLGTLLNEGLVMQVDQGQARQYPYNWCTRSGCFARFGLTQAEVNSLKAGNVARLRLLSASAPDQPVILEVSLTGFTAAYEALGAKTGGN